jgi:hypothetical protein
MTRRNDRARKKSRSAKGACKVGRFTTQGLAEDFLLRLAEAEPLNTLGMRAYPCLRCGFYHIGRGQSR